ncbi:hypothetical protein PLESTB_001027100 [Pleodorina starrii]|uniref:Ankyrin repeat domain-containing protein n=1 Tax=Pleodorina starrii TaxID=330485 RepID=A0A9W6F4W3_9CHLO|nr:hypothetical protein PLESTM_001815000 [Pleodorina starrii]GLC55771.1 hypothetical protein PLESTB_001027100 [Pleodorina starrii]GLC68845.1 hypothetical protein PLESTF_000744700 [Pleodorina starrii]
MWLQQMITSAGDEEACPAWSVAAIVERIAEFTSENEVACTLRLLNKFTAAVLRGRTKVRISKSSPSHAFARRWGAPGAMRPLTCKQRKALLRLTAATGSVANLQLALAAVGCTPTSEVFAAAAAAGHLPVCEALLAAGCPWGPDVLDAAARAGLRESVSWLLRAGCPAGPQLLEAAAGAGHAELCEWLVSEVGLAWSAKAARAAARGGFTALFEHAVAELGLPGAGGHAAAASTAAGGPGAVLGELLEGAAEGCDLATVMWLHRTWLEPEEPDLAPQNAAAPGNNNNNNQQQQQGGVNLLSRAARDAVMAAAAASPTPDWRAKVEWLRARGYPSPHSACIRVAAAAASSLPDAAARLGWLVQQGFRLQDRSVAAALVSSRRVDLLGFLQEQPSASRLLNLVARKATEEKDGVESGFLRELVARGARLCGTRWLEAFASSGDVEAAEWLLETLGGKQSGEGGGGGKGGNGEDEVRLTAAVFAAGAGSSSGAMLRWLRDRGCEWNGSAFAAAADAGCEEQMEWLAAAGCPFGDDGEPYVRAARNGDLATLRLLRRLGCPWGPPGDTFTAAIAWACELPVLAWMLDAGCPVDWSEAMDAASVRQRPAGVVQWLEAQQGARACRRRRCVVQ